MNCSKRPCLLHVTVRAGKRAPQVNALITKPGDSNSVFRIYVVEETDSCKFSSDFHVYAVACAQEHAHTHTCTYAPTHTRTARWEYL